MNKRRPLAWASRSVTLTAFPGHTQLIFHRKSKTPVIEVIHEPASPAAIVLSDYVSSLQFEMLPQDVRQTAFLILKDAVACAAFGARFEWAQIAAQYVRSLEGKPEVPIFGFDALSAPVPSAAFLFGVMGHAYELDNLRSPGAGVHPGVTVALPVLAYALAHPEVTAEDIITAIVAGCEVMFRIGAATLHTPEKAGFHAPGLTGAFGAATAVGKLMGLDAQALRNAYGISGSVGAAFLLSPAQATAAW